MVLLVKTLKMLDKGINTYFDNSHKYKNPKGKVSFQKNGNL